DGNDDVVKWGITDEVKNPTARYGKDLPPGAVKVKPRARGTRASMLKLERELEEKIPGPENKVPWRGKKQGQPLSKRAQACT
ncbi:MAG: hypothetical protein IAG13_19445, partial [Deltaproteobacteria bacterium]|nr:hypothetical protein [Nannocystaceae bacterium]